MDRLEQNAVKKKAFINLALLLAFSAVMMVGACIMRNQLIDNSHDMNTLLVGKYADDEEDIINTYENLLDLCTKFIDEKELENASVEEIKSGLYPYFDGFYNLYAGDSMRAIAIVNGQILSNNAYFEDFDDGVYNYAETNWYKGAMAAGGNVYMTNAYRDYSTGKIQVTFAQKAEHSDSVMLFDIFFEDYHTGKEELELPENGAYYLCDSEGTVMFSQTQVYDDYGEMQDFATGMIKKLDNASGGGYLDSYIDAKGNKRSAYTQRLNNDWVIIFTIPRDNAIGGMDKFYLVIGVIFVFGLVLISYLAWREYSQMRNSLRLVEEKERIRHTAEVYQKTMMSTVLTYREICYLDLERLTYQVTYPEHFVRAKRGSYENGRRVLLDQGVLSGDDLNSLESFLNLDNVRKELADKDCIETRCRHRDDKGVYEECVLTITVVDRVAGVPVSATFAVRSIENVLKKEEAQRELLELEAQRAEAANHAKSDFLSNMSHDIRTPMNAILGMTAIAAMHVDDREWVLDALNKITISGKHLLGLINSVLDMSKIESGKISLNEDEFSLSDLVENLLALFNSQITAKGLELKVNIAKIEHENVIGDEQRLQQIFVNILGNAVKFTPEGGKIELSIREKKANSTDRACYEFVFTDNGIGMEKEFVDKIFEPFSRAFDSRVHDIEGTGLGMPIAVNVARLMGGDIQVESELGKGSRFTVTVYLKFNDADEADLKELVALPVLVVDDEELACISACEILNSLEMQAEYVIDGDSAVARVVEAHKAENDFSLVIMDWKMPGKDGLETTREIRRVLGNEIPIIILSAYDWSAIEQEAVLAGVNAFIEKPLFKSRLTHVLKEVLGIYHEEDKKPETSAFMEHGYKGKRVLLAEDNELNIEVASEILRVAGFEVDTAVNGIEAVNMAVNHEDGYYDLIFMDIQMPIMNGYEATEAIRSSGVDYLKRIPIVAMTADAFVEDVKKARQSGMNGHIAKPIDIAKLEKMIGEWL